MAPVRTVFAVTMILALVPPAAVAGHAASTRNPLPAGHADIDPSSDAPASLTSTPETDNTVTRIAVRADGDARWTVTVRTRLETDEDVEEYHTFQKQFREDPSRFSGPFAERMDGIVSQSSNVTGREMTVENVTASTDVQAVPRRWGVVSFTFTWTNFTAHESESLVVGDAFEGGFFLAEGDSLIVEAPPGYAVRSTDPDPAETDEGSVTWDGREDFADRRPRVELVPATTASPPATSSTTEQRPGSGSGSLLLGAAAVALSIAGLAAIVVRRLNFGSPSTGEAGAEAKTAAGSGSTVLTDAEKVETLLADNDGRMKQSVVADTLDWSASKTSRVVGSMVDEGRVDKLRIGRENVLDLQEDTQ